GPAWRPGPGRGAGPTDALRRGDMLRDVLNLDGPAAAVHAERLLAARGGEPVEAALDDAQQRAALGLLQLEHDQRRRLLGIIDRGLDRRRVPAKRQQALRLHPLDGHVERQVLVPGIGDLALHALAGGEALSLERNLEPVAE